jgi:lipopolysaccharide biosynthesis glycosyltransferase
MTRENIIYLASNCDNDFVLFYAALLKSIEKNHHTGEKIISYLIGDNITDENKRKVQDSLDQGIIEIRWLSSKSFLPDGLNLPDDRSLFPITIYMNLYLAYSLPQEIKKILYLDVDLIVQDDISNLYNIDLGENIIAAALDRYKNFGHSWGGVRNYKVLGFSPELPYLNTGVMLIDTEKWRAHDITAKTIYAINTYKKYSHLADQYGLNVVFGKLPWFILPQKWNHVSFEIPTERPSIIHFIAEKPTYTTYKGLAEFSHIFYDYLSLTQFKETKKNSRLKTRLKKTKIVIHKLYRKLFNDFKV